MIEKILNNMKISASNDDVLSRRNHERRSLDHCIAIVNGKSYPVVNWSQGGMLLAGDGRELAEGEPANVTIKFKTEAKILTITHRGQILRSTSNLFAIKFAPLTQDVDRTFQYVVDDHNAQRFASSQS